MKCYFYLNTIITFEESAFRLPEAETLLPKIPVQPIGYDEAEVLLRYFNKLNLLSFCYNCFLDQCLRKILPRQTGRAV